MRSGADSVKVMGRLRRKSSRDLIFFGEPYWGGCERKSRILLYWATNLWSFHLTFFKPQHHFLQKLTSRTGTEGRSNSQSFPFKFFWHNSSVYKGKQKSSTVIEVTSIVYTWDLLWSLPVENNAREFLVFHSFRWRRRMIWSERRERFVVCLNQRVFMGECDWHFYGIFLVLPFVSYSSTHRREEIVLASNNVWGIWLFPKAHQGFVCLYATDISSAHRIVSIWDGSSIKFDSELYCFHLRQCLRTCTGVNYSVAFTEPGKLVRNSTCSFL